MRNFGVKGCEIVRIAFSFSNGIIELSFEDKKTCVSPKAPHSILPYAIRGVPICGELPHPLEQVSKRGLPSTTLLGLQPLVDVYSLRHRILNCEVVLDSLQGLGGHTTSQRRVSG